MSADNWARCPRCVKKDADAVAVLEEQVTAAYGSVSVDEFDRMRDELTQRRAGHDDSGRFHTFREDYEFYGAEDGEVTATYRGQCSECGLSLKFEHTHALDVDGGAS